MNQILCLFIQPSRHLQSSRKQAFSHSQDLFYTWIEVILSKTHVIKHACVHSLKWNKYKMPKKKKKKMPKHSIYSHRGWPKCRGVSECAGVFSRFLLKYKILRTPWVDWLELWRKCNKRGQDLGINHAKMLESKRRSYLSVILVGLWDMSPTPSPSAAHKALPCFRPLHITFSFSFPYYVGWLRFPAYWRRVNTTTRYKLIQQ